MSNEHKAIQTWESFEGKCIKCVILKKSVKRHNKEIDSKSIPHTLQSSPEKEQIFFYLNKKVKKQKYISARERFTDSRDGQKNTAKRKTKYNSRYKTLNLKD